MLSTHIHVPSTLQHHARQFTTDCPVLQSKCINLPVVLLIVIAMLTSIMMRRVTYFIPYFQNFSQLKQKTQFQVHANKQRSEKEESRLPSTIQNSAAKLSYMAYRQCCSTRHQIYLHPFPVALRERIKAVLFKEQKMKSLCYKRLPAFPAYRR